MNENQRNVAEHVLHNVLYYRLQNKLDEFTFSSEATECSWNHNYYDLQPGISESKFPTGWKNGIILY
jgi:hypothetical protein